MMIMNDVEDIKTKIMRDYLDIVCYHNKNEHFSLILRRQININIQLFKMQEAHKSAIKFHENALNDEEEHKIINELKEFEQEVLQCDIESLVTLYHLS